jgi:alkyl hydroperoxide reductase subunit F
MEQLMSDGAVEQLNELFKKLDKPVQLLLFTEPSACGACADQRRLLEELTGLSDKLSLQVHPLDSGEALTYAIEKAPATVVRGEKDYGIRFFGLTGGYEFSSLIEAVELVSRGTPFVEPAISALGKTINRPTHIETMVTLSCPYCPNMVRLIHQLAFVNENIRADMVDAAEFPQLVSRYDVHGVPLTAVNGKRAFEGALEPDQAVLEILKIVDPDAFETINAKLREAQGLRHAREIKSEELYDVIVVGAGPAGLTAALYAQRKGRKTALIGKQAGGQINDTATVENYPGIVQIGGSELARAMREHVETYPVAERCHTQVESIVREGDLFKVITEEGQAYRGRSLIYCAGKRYRRLNVPGEERFIGRGVAWCATCDAPLYRDKRVVVVGGGNSALTAVRDLLRYASAVHVVHHKEEFDADPVLIEEIGKAEADGRVILHLNSRVREYLGGDRLEGVRLSGTQGEVQHDLAAEGVFLEIGLEPNSGLLEGLLEFNEHGEVPVERDQSTDVAGLFAAGDVTDEREKQIVVAAGAGAKAALSADRYLSTVGED